MQTGSGILSTLDPGVEKVGSEMNISDPQHWFHYILPVLLFKLVQVVIEPVLPATARLHSRVPNGQEFFFAKKELTFRAEKKEQKGRKREE
jgi:hypothetical protein